MAAPIGAGRSLTLFTTRPVERASQPASVSADTDHCPLLTAVFEVVFLVNCGRSLNHRNVSSFDLEPWWGRKAFLLICFPPGGFCLSTGDLDKHLTPFTRPIGWSQSSSRQPLCRRLLQSSMRIGFPVLNCVVTEHFLVCLWIWWSWSGASNDLRCPTLRLNIVSAWVDGTILPCTRFTKRSCRLFSLVMDRGFDSPPALLNSVGFTLAPERWATWLRRPPCRIHPPRSVQRPNTILASVCDQRVLLTTQSSSCTLGIVSGWTIKSIAFCPLKAFKRKFTLNFSWTMSSCLAYENECFFLCMFRGVVFIRFNWQVTYQILIIFSWLFGSIYFGILLPKSRDQIQLKLLWFMRFFMPERLLQCQNVQNNDFE